MLSLLFLNSSAAIYFWVNMFFLFYMKIYFLYKIKYRFYNYYVFLFLKSVLYGNIFFVKDLVSFL